MKIFNPLENINLFCQLRILNYGKCIFYSVNKINYNESVKQNPLLGSLN